MDNGAETKVGILGGTFNPVHMGHLILAQCAFETFDLSKVLFIPCATPPHKVPSDLLQASHRTAMVEAAIEGDLRFEISDIEVKRRGISYAVDTVCRLQEIYQGAELYFIIGADTLLELHLWKNINQLLAMCKFATFGRPGFDIESICAENLQLGPAWAKRLLQNVTTGRMIDIASSDIRHGIAEGMSIRYLVPPAVEMYIAEHNLYGK